ncbi:hypothetical protein [Flammeovirga sp. EKP202]|uniref:hypothetical protein n=1 Tax=Flammeovirga sp. EKP202 TaxID=2770592 RepID=UPI00165EE3EA|nr:hypothetical protein [Flammeovirga sp. EKP202]MBD0403017.1 hypothetical protein [Flammeovirga sp. EKP202]
MTKQEAKRLLMLHSFMSENINHPKMENGFIGSLRPFSGKLNENNFHEVVKAIKTLSEEIRSEKIDREIMAAIWNICHLTKSWGTDDEGLLQRNNLISKEQILILENWVEKISYITMMLLNGCDISTAFEFYDNEV